MAHKVTAEDLYQKYANRPLRIKVSFWGATLRGRPLAPFTQERIWDPRIGLEVEGGGGEHGDHERFPNEWLAKVHPDVDYVWLIDFVRKLQLIWNFFARLANQVGLRILPIVEPIDLWGDIHYRAPTGRETLSLRYVRHPAELAHMLQTFASTLETYSALYKTARQQIAVEDLKEQIRRERDEHG